MISRKKWVRGIAMVAVTVALVFLLAGCKEEAEGPANGTITAGVTGAGVQDGKAFYMGVWTAGVAIYDADPLGAGVSVIVGGEASAPAYDPATFLTTPTTVTFTGGNTYDVYGFIDVDNSLAVSGDIADLISAGDFTTVTPVTVEVDGNKSVTFSYASDFKEMFSITVEATGLDAADTVNLLVGVFPAGADPATDDPIGVGFDVIGATVSGEATVLVQNDMLTVTMGFADGTHYDVYAIIDVDDSDGLSSGDYMAESPDLTVTTDEVVSFTLGDFSEVL